MTRSDRAAALARAYDAGEAAGRASPAAHPAEIRVAAARYVAAQARRDAQLLTARNGVAVRRAYLRGVDDGAAEIRAAAE